MKSDGSILPRASNLQTRLSLSADVFPCFNVNTRLKPGRPHAMVTLPWRSSSDSRTLGLSTTSALSDDDVWPREPARRTPSSRFQCSGQCTWSYDVPQGHTCRLLISHDVAQLFGHMQTEAQETRSQKSGSWILLDLGSGFLRVTAAGTLSHCACGASRALEPAEQSWAPSSELTEQARAVHATPGGGDPARCKWVPFPS